jgi:hypothetical protein
MNPRKILRRFMKKLNFVNIFLQLELFMDPAGRDRRPGFTTRQPGARQKCDVARLAVT